MASTQVTDPSMDERATAFIESLAEKSRGTALEDTWYCVAGCAFAAANQSKYVAEVFTVAIRDHETDHEFHKRILRRIKVTESLLKTSVIYGIPRVINAFRALVQAIPSPESNETVSVREHIREPSQTDERGMAYLRNIFRADLDPFLELMDQYWPDLRELVVTTIYGYYQSEVGVIDAITTSQINIATLVPMDTAPEVAWHMRGLIRNGGTREQLQAAYDITVSACEICDVRLKNKMPVPEDVIHEEHLFHYN